MAKKKKTNKKEDQPVLAHIADPEERAERDAGQPGEVKTVDPLEKSADEGKKEEK